MLLATAFCTFFLWCSRLSVDLLPEACCDLDDDDGVVLCTKYSLPVPGLAACLRFSVPVGPTDATLPRPSPPPKSMYVLFWVMTRRVSKTPWHVRDCVSPAPSG